MSGKATGWVLQHFPIERAADRNRKLVLLSVADAANQHGETARVAADVVCEEWGFDEKTVRRHLSDLVADGWLAIEQESRGRGGPKVYRLPGMITGLSAYQSEALLPGDSGAESEKMPGNTAADTSLSSNGSNGTRAEARSSLVAEFDLWWKQYPRRPGTRDKPTVKKLYLARRKTATAEDLMAAAVQYAQERADEDPQWTIGERRFLDADDGPWREALDRSRRPARRDGPVTADDLARAQAPLDADDPRIR